MTDNVHPKVAARRDMDADAMVQGFCGPATPGTRFLGQPVEDLSRESLLAIIDWLGTKYITSLRSGVVEPVHQPVPKPPVDIWGEWLWSLVGMLCWIGCATVVVAVYLGIKWWAGL